jgi:hypothetical protein
MLLIDDVIVLNIESLDSDEQEIAMTPLAAAFSCH